MKFSTSSVVFVIGLIVISAADKPETKSIESTAGSKTAEASERKTKRGLFDLGLHEGFEINGGFNHGDSHGFAEQSHGNSEGSFGEEQKDHIKTITIHKEIKVPVPHPYPVPVEKRVPYPVKVIVKVPVDKPYPVHIPKPYPVTVEKPVPYSVEKKVPVPYKVSVKVPYPVKVAVPVSKPYPVHIIKKIPYPVPAPYIVEKKVPVLVKSHHDEGLSGHEKGFEEHYFNGGLKHHY